MKRLLTLSAAIACSIGTQAQQAQKPANALLPKRAGTTHTPAKTTGADSRLIASVELTYGASSFEVDDSTVVSYTGNNGWDYATQGWKFDTGTVYTYDQSTTSWDDDGGVKQQLANNRIMSTLFRQRVGSVWQDDQKSAYTYTSNGLLATEEYEMNSGSGLEPTGRSTHTYNGDMQITQTVQDNWSGSAWIPGSRTVNRYNSAKQLDTSWNGSWIAMTSQWQDFNRIIYTYANGRLTQLLQQSNTGSSWDDSYRATFSYDANGNQSMVENETWNSGSSTWVKNFRTEYAYNSAGDMIEEKDAHWTGSAYEYQSKTVYTYDQFHHILTEESQSWNSTNQWYYDTGDDYQTRNYYEGYTNDVKEAKASNLAQLNVFPVPAKEQLTISASFSQAQPVTIRIMDMNGRVVKQLADQAGAQYRKSIDVTDIPAGNYLVNISGTTEVASRLISVTR